MTYEQYCLDNLGYQTITTYWDDFTIAEHFGKNAIKDTYKRAMLNTEYKMLTELCMVLNHKIWFLYENNPKLAEIYNDLWKKCDEYIINHLKGEQLQYFLRTTD